MGLGRGITTFALAAVATLASAATASAADTTPQTRYSLVHGCYGLQAPGGKFVAKTPDNAYAATADSAASGEIFRMQATDLGRYMLYGRAQDYLAGNNGNVFANGQPNEMGDWQVDDAGAGTFTLTLWNQDKALGVGDGGKLALVDPAGAARFTFVPASGCPAYPEVDTNTTGEPLKGASPFGEVAGTLDAHIHMMAFEFLGGDVHCGRPWSPYGVTIALVDCPDHYGTVAPLENVISYGNPARTHDPVGWPTFKDWPAAASLTHEQTYYKWLERAWRGGLRTYVNLLVDNAVLCEAYPLKRHNCDEMDTVRLEAKDIYKLQDYIDAQSGGPGKGWFRIVTTPFQARKVIASGKLAVILGIEVSKLFGCGEQNDVPTCTAGEIDQRLDEVYGLGVRDMELVNKFDNGLAGVAGDSGNTGNAVNAGNVVATGHFWGMQTCTGPAGANDREQPLTLDRDALIGFGLEALLPPGTLPVYPAAPHCNKRGLTSLGAHLVNRMIDKKMIVDPDHMSVLARDQTLSILEARKYSGVISSHSWSSPDSYPRIYNLGGVITPYAGNSTTFVKQWQAIKPLANKKFYWGFGYGADMNGFGHQGDPRPGNEQNPVKYPFKSFDGGVTLDRGRSGQRVWDINKDGVAQYGLYPDWIEDLRMIAGDQIVADMARGSEAYLQMWERAEGVPATACAASRSRFTHTRILGVTLNATAEKLLRTEGQPGSRPGRPWTWCVNGEANGQARLTSVLSQGGRVTSVWSTARYHKALDIGSGQPATKLNSALLRRQRVKQYGAGVYVTAVKAGSRYVFGVKKGKVAFVGLVRRSVAKSPATLRAELKLAGF